MKIRAPSPLHNRVPASGRSAASSIAAAVSAILSATAAPVMAQQATQAAQQVAADDTLETVIVTGIHRSIQEAVQTKRQDDSIVEVVTQEDIGKLPDPSVAESISRLPGVAGQRVNGRVQDIAVRGFNGDFVTTLLNGREQASTGDNRAVEFDQYPGEVIQSVLVYKTNDAERVSEGLAGTIDLRTTRPLTYSKDVFAVGLRGEKNSLGSLNSGYGDKGYRFNATYIGRFDDNKLGLTLGYARLDSPEQEQHYKSWWYGGDGPNGEFVLDGAELYAYSRKDVRDGLVGVIEFKPNDFVHSTTDLYYSQYTQKSVDRGWEAFLAPYVAGPILNPVITTVNGIGFVDSGTYTNVQGIVLNQFQKTKDKLFAIGENLELSFDKWNAAADLSYSYADRKLEWVEGFAGYGIDPAQPHGQTTPDSVNFSNVLGAIPTLTPGLNYADASKMYLGDPAPWGGWGHDGGAHYPESKDTIKSLKFTGDRPVGGVFDLMSVGVQFQQRDKSRAVLEYDLNTPGDPANGIPVGTPTLVPSNLLVSPTSIGFGGAGNLVSYDLAQAVDSYYVKSLILDSNHYNKDWTVGEKLTSGFVQFRLKTKLGSAPVTGNIGVQIVHASQSSTGFYQVAGTNPIEVSLVSRGASYTDVLPSLNLKIEFEDNIYLRFAAAKQMVRPRMEDMRGSLTASVDPITRTWSGSGGNPALRPWRADAFDLAWEKYFSKSSYFGLNVWFKDLKSFIYTNVSDSNFDFSNFDPHGIQPTSNFGYMTLPTNGSGGTARGLEAALNLEGSLLWRGLEGFGTEVNMAWTRSTVPPDLNLGPSFPGLSPKIRSMTVYYERYGFSARLSERWRAPFLGGVQSLFGQRAFSQIEEDRQLDASMGYTFGSGPAKGLAIQALVQNLRDSPYRDTTGLFSNGLTTPQTYELYGRTVLLGVNYKL
jgi:iron complex outermembrane receptor protein